MKKEQYERMREYAHCVVKMASVHSGDFNNLDTVEYATFSVMHLMYRMNLTDEQFAIFEQGFVETRDFLNRRLAHYNSTQIDLNQVTFNFNLERMKAAVESKRIPIPPEALTSEETFDKWLNEDNDEPTN